MDRTLALAEGLQKADIEITKRGQIFRAMHSYSALLIAGGIVFAARKRSTNGTIHNAKSQKRIRQGSGSVLLIAGILSKRHGGCVG